MDEANARLFYDQPHIRCNETKFVTNNLKQNQQKYNDEQSTEHPSRDQAVYKKENKKPIQHTSE